MGTLHVLTLLLSAVLLCSAAPALGPVTCTEGNGSVTVNVAVHHINDHHEHGYKFRLHEVQGNKVEQVDGGCNVELQLDLRETKCHTINPQPFEDCKLREMNERAVMAICTVLMTVKDGEANITKYQCDTKQVTMTPSCPDCPSLIALNSTEGLKSVHEAVKEFNKNTSNQHYYILKEVGRISSGHMMMSGMNYYAEFVLVETRCPVGSRIVPEACKPFCPDRARHAFCRSSYSAQNGLTSIDCEVYPALNSTALGPGERDPFCKRHGRHHSHGHGHGHSHGHGGPPQPGSGGPPPHGHGRPPHAGSGGPSPHAHDHGHGRPPHAGSGGPPPHAHDHGHGPPPHAGSKGPPAHAHDHGQSHGRHRPCNGFVANPDPALHPICPFPLPSPRNTQS